MENFMIKFQKVMKKVNFKNQMKEKHLLQNGLNKNKKQKLLKDVLLLNKM